MASAALNTVTNLMTQALGTTAKVTHLGDLPALVDNIPLTFLLLGHCLAIAGMTRGRYSGQLMAYVQGFLMAFGGSVASNMFLGNPTANVLFQDNMAVLLWTASWWVVNHNPLALVATALDFPPVGIVARVSLFIILIIYLLFLPLYDLICVPGLLFCSPASRSSVLASLLLRLMRLPRPSLASLPPLSLPVRLLDLVERLPRTSSPAWLVFAVSVLFFLHSGCSPSHQVTSQPPRIFHHFVSLFAAPLELSAPTYVLRSSLVGSIVYYIVVHALGAMSSAEGTGLLLVAFLSHTLTDDLLGAAYDYTAPVIEVFTTVTLIAVPTSRGRGRGRSTTAVASQPTTPRSASKGRTPRRTTRKSD